MKLCSEFLGGEKINFKVICCFFIGRFRGCKEHI